MHIRNGQIGLSLSNENHMSLLKTIWWLNGHKIKSINTLYISVDEIV